MVSVSTSTEPRWRLVLPASKGLPDLTEEQLAAARPASGVKVVLGGPGTGKTTTLVAATVEHLRAGARLDQLAVLASSRSEAQELRRRIVREASGAQTSPKVTTIHGLALGWLREFSDPDEQWWLLRAPEQELRIRELLEVLGPEFWPASLREAVPTRGFARQLREVLARARQLSMDPDDVARNAAAQSDELFSAVATFFEQYLSISDLDGSLDYAELVHRARLLLHDDAAASSIAAGTRAIIVDDVQSLDPAQLKLLLDCSRAGIAVHAFGDPQQRIHGFRGATADALPTLMAVPDALVHQLSEGFRNQEAVAEALGSLRSRITSRGAAQPPRPARGSAGFVSATVYDDDPSQWAHVAQQLRSAVLTEGLAWSDLAVIVRAGRVQLAPVARELARYGVPVEVAGDEIPLAAQLAVRVLLLALEVARGGGKPDADETARLFSSPLGGLDSVGQRRLGRQLLAAHPEQGNSAQLLGRCLEHPELLNGISGEEAEVAKGLASLLGKASETLENHGSVLLALWQLWESTDWPTRLRDSALGGSRQATQDLDAIVELFDLAARRSELVGPAGARTFISEVAGQEIPGDTGRELELAGRGVRLLTAHRAKTGQWRRVWVVGVSEGRWPRATSTGLLLDPDRLAPDHLDAVSPAGVLGDERRLFHVACSRAREELHVSAAQGVEGEAGRPSRFLEELGVQVSRVHGRPTARLSAAALIAELRLVTSDPEQPPAMRRAAAARLARLAVVTDAEGGKPFRAAAPSSWWGVQAQSSEGPGIPERVRITGSQLETLLACPRRWFLARRAGADIGRASRASVGDVVHHLAKRAHTEGLDGEELRAELARVWERIPFEAEWLSVSERAEMEAAIDRFAVWNDESDAEVLGVEVDFEVSLDVAGREVQLAGSVDRLELVDGALRVLDLKTGRSLPRAKDVLDNSQLGVYQLAASLGAFDDLAPGTREVSPAGLVMLRHGERHPEIVWQPSLSEHPTLADEDPETGPTWVHDQLATAVSIIDSGRFPAQQCSACNYCAFADGCPAIHDGGQEIGS